MKIRTNFGIWILFGIVLEIGMNGRVVLEMVEEKQIVEMKNNLKNLVKLGPKNVSGVTRQQYAIDVF